MDNIKIIRKRIVPQEEVELKDDVVIYVDHDKGIIVTKWLPIKKRQDIGWGYSVYNFPQNYKVSAFFEKNGRFVKWYCDIVKCDYLRSKALYVVTDLLIDVVKYSTGKIEVLDEEELYEAVEIGLISENDFILAKSVSLKVIEMFSDENFSPLDCIGEDIIVSPPENFVVSS